MTRITNDDLNKKILKHRTELEMRMALNDFISQKYSLRIPPQVEDADMVLHDVINELLEARKKLAILEPLRDALISEHAWEEALRDPGKVFDSMVRPLQPVKTPIHDAIKASAMTTREEAEKAANAELEPYMSLPASSFLHQIPIEIDPTLPENTVKIGDSALYFIGLDDGYHGVESMEVLQEEQEG